MASAELIVIGTPMAACAACCNCQATARPHRLAVQAVLRCTGGTGLMAHEVCAEVAPQLASGVLSGPSFAQEVARAQPTALVAASRHEGVRDALVQAFHGPSLRVYASEDIVGVEVGGAVKNVLAIATGPVTARSWPERARRADHARPGRDDAPGLAPRAYRHLHGPVRPGDLALTATGDLSRNRRVGLLLADGKSPQQAVDLLGHVAEGVYSARTVVAARGRRRCRSPNAWWRCSTAGCTLPTPWRV